MMMIKSRAALESIALFWILSIAWFLFFFLEVIGLFMPLWAYAVYALTCGVLVRRVLVSSQVPSRKIVYGFFFGCFLAALTYQNIFFASRRGFVSRLYSVRPGMTVAEVENIMARYHEFDFSSPNVNKGANGELSSISYRHADANDGCFNADVGTVIFKNERVASVRFSPD